MNTIAKPYVTKPLQNPEKVVESLLALRDELLAKASSGHQDVLFKINSCLYSEYPHHNHKQ